MPRTLKLTIAYDGTDYAGWQRQANAIGIQQVLEDEIAAIVGAHHPLNAAGRTDAGVHAAAQVASITIDHPIPADELLRALNARLKAGDIRIRSIEEMPDRWDARFYAKGKTYRYAIWNGAAPSPFLRHVVWHVPQPLDLDRMQRAAARVVGEHDFAAFQGRGSDVQTTVRRVLVGRHRRDEHPHRSADRAVAARRRADATARLFVSRSAAPDFCVTWCAPSSARSSTSAAATSAVDDMRAIIESRDRAGRAIRRRLRG